MTLARISHTSPPSLSIAVINFNLRGYPEDCLESLGAAAPQTDTEFLLIHDAAAGEGDRIAQRFPGVRVLRADRGDRATAKNLALAEARGGLVLLVTADTIARPDAVKVLRRFVEGQSSPALVSAQLLCENGMRRRSVYIFPSILREINPFAWLFRRYHRAWHKGRPPAAGTAAHAAALHATFLMARREVFQQIGPFTEGYRFAHEDVEYSWRASRRGIARLVLMGAHVFKISPQLYGELSVNVRTVMEHSLYRLAGATRGTAYGTAFRSVRMAKSLSKWILASALNRITCGCSVLLANEAAVHAAILGMNLRKPTPASLEPDAESHVRWEYAV